MDDRSTQFPQIPFMLGSEAAPIIVNVRRDADFAGADTPVADVFHRSADTVEQRAPDRDRTVAVSPQ